MGHMKHMLSLVSGLIASLFVFAGIASAREGLVTMSNSDVSCEAISLWKEGRYRVTGRCEGLVYPYATQYSYYTLWAKTDVRGEMTRVGQVEKGYFDGSAASAFSNLYITAETESLPRRPSDKAIVSGTITAFAFDNSRDTTVPVASTAPTANNGTMTVQQGATSTAGSTVGTVMGRIVRSLLIIIAVVVVIVIGTSLIFRRRGSVSG